MTRRRLNQAVMAIALSVAVFVWAPGATAITGTGSIEVGHPATAFPGGVTEKTFQLVANCVMTNSTFAKTQGQDGWVIQLPAVTTGKTLSLTSSSSINPNYLLNFFFYNASCVRFGSPYSYPLYAQSYSGGLPEGARWLLVSAGYGAKISLTYSITP